MGALLTIETHTCVIGFFIAKSAGSNRHKTQSNLSETNSKGNTSSAISYLGINKYITFPQ